MRFFILLFCFYVTSFSETNFNSSIGYIVVNNMSYKINEYIKIKEESILIKNKDIFKSFDSNLKINKQELKKFNNREYVILEENKKIKIIGYEKINGFSLILIQVIDII